MTTDKLKALLRLTINLADGPKSILDQAVRHAAMEYIEQLEGQLSDQTAEPFAFIGCDGVIVRNPLVKISFIAGTGVLGKVPLYIHLPAKTEQPVMAKDFTDRQEQPSLSDAQPVAAKHSDDVAVDRFALAMKSKLSKKRDEGRGGWETCDVDDLHTMMCEHVHKRDPVDIANFAMMIHQHPARRID